MNTCGAYAVNRSTANTASTGTWPRTHSTRLRSGGHIVRSGRTTSPLWIRKAVLGVVTHGTRPISAVGVSGPAGSVGAAISGESVGRAVRIANGRTNSAYGTI